MDVEKIVEKVFKEVVKQLQSEKKEQAIIIGSRQQENEFCAQYNCVPFSEASEQDGFERVIITDLPNNMLINLANGSFETPEEAYILNHLLLGKKVFVLEDGVEFSKYKQTAPKALYDMYFSYFDKLGSYGILFISEKEEAPSSMQNSNVTAVSGKKVRIDKRIITEMDLQKQFFKKATCIQIPEKSIITPLAADYLKKHRMEIQRYEGE